MKQIWYIANIGLVVLASWDGYRSITPERLLRANPDSIACFALFAIMPLFTLGCVYYSTRRWGQNTLRHPTDAHKADAAKKLENYNAQLVAEMIQKQAGVPAIPTTVN
jgi:hypothetical protein